MKGTARCEEPFSLICVWMASNRKLDLRYKLPSLMAPIKWPIKPVAISGANKIGKRVLAIDPIEATTGQGVGS